MPGAYNCNGIYNFKGGCLMPVRLWLLSLAFALMASTISTCADELVRIWWPGIKSCVRRVGMGTPCRLVKRKPCAELMQPSLHVTISQVKSTAPLDYPGATNDQCESATSESSLFDLRRRRGCQENPLAHIWVVLRVLSPSCILAIACACASVPVVSFANRSPRVRLSRTPPWRKDRFPEPTISVEIPL